MRSESSCDLERNKMCGSCARELAVKLMAFLANAIFLCPIWAEKGGRESDTRDGLNEWGQPENIVFQETKIKHFGVSNNINNASPRDST